MMVPRHCGAHNFSQIDASRYVFIWDRQTWFRDGPGGIITGTVQNQSQIAASISVGASISINDIVAESQVTVSASVTKTVSTTKGHLAATWSSAARDLGPEYEQA